MSLPLLSFLRRVHEMRPSLSLRGILSAIVVVVYVPVLIFRNPHRGSFERSLAALAVATRMYIV